MKIKVDNKTWFRSDDIRNLVRRAIAAEGQSGRDYTVEVRYARGGDIGGYGWYHQRKIKMCIPKHESQWHPIRGSKPTPYGFTPSRIKTFAQVVIHELGHNQGLRHAEMASWTGIEVSWSEGMTIRRAEEKKKVDKVAQREATARAKVEEYEKKIKRHQHLLKKWKGKVAYYDRKNRAAAQKE